MAGISLKNIKKTYQGGVTVIEDLNLEIKDKEFIILVGPSGCGKSTTLRMIAGLEEITGGEMYIGDRLINDVHPKERDIAMVFQSYALYPHMSVYKNMAFGLELRKVPKNQIDHKVREAAKILDIEHLLDRKPKALSGGQRQRVALGRAMVRNPQVFLLDEPLSNLDAKLRTAMRTEIIKLHKQLQTTFVYVTHDQVEAMTMADRIVVMKDGVIQQVDTPQNLYLYPQNLFVAGFIGSPQMNFVDVEIVKEGNNYGGKFEGFTMPIPADKIEDVDMDKYVGKTVVMGIRPEEFDIEKANNENYATITADIDIAELMGSEIYIHFMLAGEKAIAKAPASFPKKSGEKVDLGIDTNKIHLFDKETGKVICN